MGKTVCEFVYETYRSPQWPSIASCSAYFLGNNAELYTIQWSETACKDFFKVNDEIKELREKMRQLDEEYKSLADDRTFFQKLTKNKNTPNWKRKKEIIIELENMEKQLSNLGMDRKWELYQMKFKTRRFLEDSGFLISSHCVDRNTHYETWTKEV